MIISQSDTTALAAVDSTGSSLQNAVTIITTIGDQWEFLIILLAVVFWIIYRKRIWTLLSRAKSFELAGQKVEFKEESVSIENVKNVGHFTKVEETTTLPIKTAATDGEGEGVSRDSLLQALDEGNISEANMVFAKLQANAATDNERQILRIDFDHYRFMYGQPGALSEMEKFRHEIESKEVLEHSTFAIARAHYYSENYPSSVMEFEKLKEGSKSQLVVGYLWRAYYFMGEKAKAKKYLLEEVEKYDSDYKANAYKYLGDFYEKEGSLILKAFAYEKAIEYQPNNTGLLFSAAYSYSEKGYDLLALNHYFRSLSFKEDAGSHNNLGVLLLNLDCKFSAIRHYKKAFDLGETLGASNTAYQLINVGFEDEAAKILSEALTRKEVHNNVWSAKEKLETELAKEKQKIEGLRDNHDQKNFLRAFIPPMLASTELRIKLETFQWKLEDLDVQTKTENNKLIFSWKKTDLTYSISIDSDNKAAGFATYATRPDNYRYDGYIEMTGFYYFNMNALHFLFYKGAQHLQVNLSHEIVSK